MSYSLEWSAKSKQDMRGLYVWIYERNRRAADRLHNAIEESAGLFRESPKIGLSTTEMGVLKHPVPRTEYTIFYKTTGKSVINIEGVKAITA